MNRAAWLQDRRMKKFWDVMSRWELGELSMMEAGELLGKSERQLRRYRGRYALEGIVKYQLGTAGLMWADTLGASIKQADTKRVLQLCNRLGNHRMRDCETVSRLRHAARLGDGHENLQVTKFDAAADAIRPLHIVAGQYSAINLCDAENICPNGRFLSDLAPPRAGFSFCRKNTLAAASGAELKRRAETAGRVRTSGSDAGGPGVDKEGNIFNLTLLGQYSAANFSAGADGHGPLITEPPASSSVPQTPLVVDH